jgi:digeranylgeranylglycerophospholipid reductase
MAAKTCAKYGLDTVLVERKEFVEHSRSFGCLTARRIFEYVKINEKTVDAPIYAMMQQFLGGAEISTPYHDDYEIAYVLNRKTFDNEVLNLALKEGPEYMNKTRVTGLIREDGQIKGIEAKIDEREDVEIRSNIIIGADGVESHIGRWSGIYERGLDPYETAIILDWIFDDVDVDEEMGHTYFQYANLGYKKEPKMGFPVYPKGDGKMSVQALIFPPDPTKKADLSDAMNYFIKTYPSFSRAKVIEKGGGVIPCNPLKNFTTDNVMLVGDAAHQEQQPWVAGVLQSMDCGVMAGERAVEACEEGDFSHDFLSEYEKRWYRLHGERDFVGWYMFKILWGFSPKDFAMVGQWLKDHDARFEDEIFEMVSKSSRMTAKIINEGKRQGLSINEL